MKQLQGWFFKFYFIYHFYNIDNLCTEISAQNLMRRLESFRSFLARKETILRLNYNSNQIHYY